ncbi:MAG: GGDEF domain-containing protein [Deltaproteobacteria bacterium]|jgi:two-component system cell cycle response regulator|nr:GGDEF domain-containing protein [Deltaproteobacteria bacterium]
MNDNNPFDESTRVLQLDQKDLKQNKTEEDKLKPACLVPIYGVKDMGKKYDLNSLVTSIGRSAACSILVNDESVSRKHCEVRSTSNGVYMVHDLNSTNGTYLNNEPIKVPTQIHENDQLKCGAVIFKFLMGANIERDYYEEIYKLTTVDGLTQIFNKRYYMEQLENEMSRAVRYDRDLSLIMFDIDHFKHVNDEHGHLAGDYVLRKLANAISEVIRREDIFSRYGGEEFSIILPEISLDNARFFSNKIRQVVEDTVFRFEDNIIPITISLGVAFYDPSMKTTSDFIAKADAFLYEAKNSGRNCVRG